MTFVSKPVIIAAAAEGSFFNEMQNLIRPETGQIEELMTEANLTPLDLINPINESPDRWEPKSLNPRHREIMRRLLEGANYKMIAADMGISTQTIVLLMASKLFKEELIKMEASADFNVIKRAESLCNEALDVLKFNMRNGKTDASRQRAADSILDRAGYGKIEKRVVGIVDGEAVIREINRRRRERMLGNTNEDSESADKPSYVLAEVAEG